MARCGIPSYRRRTFTKILILIISIFIVLEIAKTLQARGTRLYPTYPAEVTRYPWINLQSTATNNTKPKAIILPVVLTAKAIKSSNNLSVCKIDEGNGLPSSFVRRFPHIIIIGFGKAGTRALYQMIRMHPDIVGPSQEIRFFSNDVNYKRGLQFYIKQLPMTNELQRTIVKSPDYIIKPAAASRLKKALSYCNRSRDTKFIIVLRDPFNRAVSEYLEWKIQLFHQRQRMLSPFEKLCIKKSGQVNSLNKQVNASIYSYHVQNWLKHFKMEQICFVSGEELIRKPYLELKKLEKCLQLRNFLQPRHFYYNKEKGFYCLVDPKGNPRCLSAAKGRVHPKIVNEVETKLREFYQPFNIKLYNITGVNYGWR